MIRELIALLESIDREIIEEKRRAMIRDEALATVRIEAELERQQKEAARVTAMDRLKADGWFSGDAWAALTDKDMTFWR